MLTLLCGLDGCSCSPNIPDCVIHCESENIESTDGVLDRWRDQTDFNNDAFSLYGVPTGEVDGLKYVDLTTHDAAIWGEPNTSNHMDWDSEEGFTVFVVASVVGYRSENAGFYFGASLNPPGNFGGGVYFGESPDGKMAFAPGKTGAGGPVLYSGAGAVPGQRYLVSGRVKNPDGADMWLNGVFQGHGAWSVGDTVPNAQQCTSGIDPGTPVTRWFNGYCFCVICFERRLTDDEMEQMNSYLTAKYL